MKVIDVFQVKTRPPYYLVRVNGDTIYGTENEDDANARAADLFDRLSSLVQFAEEALEILRDESISSSEAGYICTEIALNLNLIPESE